MDEGKYYIGSDGRKHFVNEVKDMQDKTPNDVVCSKCSMIIVPALKVEAYRQRDIDEIVASHKCQRSMESKRDFEDEVR